MKKYYLFNIVIIIIIIFIFSSSTYFIFSTSVANVHNNSHSRLKEIAQYTSKSFNQTFTGEQEFILGDSINIWLHTITTLSGFEQITIVDTSGMVHYSSNEIIKWGENFRNYSTDTVTLSNALQTNTPALSPITTIDNVYFQSLYYPTLLNQEKKIIIIDASHHSLEDISQFKYTVYTIILALLGISIVLIYTVYIMGKKAHNSQNKAVQNERLAYLGRTSAELAHEIKNPLAIIKSSTDVLRMKFDPQRQEKTFLFISEEIMRVSNLIDNILSFSKEKKLDIEKRNLHNEVDRAITLIRNTLHNITIDLSIDKNISIDIDVQAFNQIITNLIRNATRAVDKNDGKISMYTRTEKKTLAIYCEDNGCGIPENITSTIFDPFVTGSKNGTGLGLAIVKSLCDALSWEIKLHSSIPSKTVFVLYVKDSLWQTSS